jgi:hypothetical protein
MMKLWLDDLRDPLNWYHQQYSGSTDDMVWVQTVQQAKTALLTGTVVTMSLDHDLGTPENGYDLVKWIMEQVWNGAFPLPEYRVHSDNGPAALMMYKSLDRIKTLVQQRELREKQ